MSEIIFPATLPSLGDFSDVLIDGELLVIQYIRDEEGDKNYLVEKLRKDQIGQIEQRRWEWNP